MHHFYPALKLKVRYRSLIARRFFRALRDTGDIETCVAGSQKATGLVNQDVLLQLSLEGFEEFLVLPTEFKKRQDLPLAHLRYTALNF